MTNLLLHQLKPQFMKILVYIGHISENAIVMEFFVILPDVPSVLQHALNVMKIIGDLPIVPDNHKFHAKFDSDPMRLMSLFFQ